MAFTIKNPPEFTLEVEQWTRETDADGDQMASGVIEPMLNNEVYLKTEQERLEHTALVILTLPLTLRPCRYPAPEKAWSR